MLTLITDGMRSVRAFHFDKAAASVLTTSVSRAGLGVSGSRSPAVLLFTPLPQMVTMEPGYLFLGSRLGNSLLLKYTEKLQEPLASSVREAADKVSAHHVGSPGLLFRDPMWDSLRDTHSFYRKSLPLRRSEWTLQRAGQVRAWTRMSRGGSKSTAGVIWALSAAGGKTVPQDEVDEIEVYGSEAQSGTQLATYSFEVRLGKVVGVHPFTLPDHCCVHRCATACSTLAPVPTLLWASLPSSLKRYSRGWDCRQSLEVEWEAVSLPYSVVSEQS